MLLRNDSLRPRIDNENTKESLICIGLNRFRFTQDFAIKISQRLPLPSRVSLWAPPGGVEALQHDTILFKTNYLQQPRDGDSCELKTAEKPTTADLFYERHTTFEKGSPVKIQVDINEASATLKNQAMFFQSWPCTTVDWDSCS